MSEELSPFRQTVRAIKAGDLDRVQELYEGDPKLKGGLEDLLDAAVEYEQLSVIEYLLEQGADATGGLRFAALLGLTQPAEWLLDRGARLNEQVDGRSFSDVLRIVAETVEEEEEDLLEMAQFLVERGACIHGIDAGGEVGDYLKSLGALSAHEYQQSGGLPNCEPAATLPGEMPLLAAVVDELNDLDQRRAYADWLVEQDDPRGEFLRQFTRSLEDEDAASFPSDAELPENWLEVIGAKMVKYLAEEDLLHLRKRLFKVAAPALSYRLQPATDDAIKVGASKVGGLPDLPEGTTWPRESDCQDSYIERSDSQRPCGFFGQFNLADIAGTLAARLLPKQGLLSIFYCINPDEGVDGVRVLYFPGTDKLRRLSPPEELHEYNNLQDRASTPASLAFTEVLDLPDDTGPWAEDMQFDEELFLRASGPTLFGYFYPTTGMDVTPSKDWQHLGRFNIGGPSIHLQISKADLKARDFDGVKLVWIDFD